MRAPTNLLNKTAVLSAGDWVRLNCHSRALEYMVVGYVLAVDSVGVKVWAHQQREFGDLHSKKYWACYETRDVTIPWRAIDRVNHLDDCDNCGENKQVVA